MAQSAQPGARELGVDPDAAHALERELEPALEDPQLPQALQLEPQAAVRNRCAHHGQDSVPGTAMRRRVRGFGFTVELLHEEKPARGCAATPVPRWQSPERERRVPIPRPWRGVFSADAVVLLSRGPRAAIDPLVG